MTLDGLNKPPLASGMGQIFRHAAALSVLGVNQTQQVPLRFQRGVTSRRWRLYREDYNKDLCIFWKC